MAKRRITKKIAAIESYCENILICNNRNLRPFIEIFVQEPENVFQENLGTLLGVFEISDDREESSYIANYLISAIKKEYFSKPKRGAIESFEAALHKANLSLSKLAEHGNVGWIGKINIVIAAIEKNNLHITKTGTAAALLVRAEALTDVSDGLSPDDPEPHPLKTFNNVASGRLEKGDKIIITTHGIFDIFSIDEIKKSALRFSESKFIQFLKTAMVNELEKAAVLFVGIKEKEAASAPVPAKTNNTLNAFSQDSFSKAVSPPKIEKELQAEISKMQEELPAKSGNGHIYIKEDPEPAKDASFPAYFSLFGEKIKDCGGACLSSSKNILAGAKAKAGGIFKKNIPAKEALPVSSGEIKEEITAEAPSKKESFNASVLAEKIRSLPNYFPAEKARGATVKLKLGLIFALKKIAPDFKKIKALAVKLDYQQRIYALVILLSIIAVPFFYVRSQNETLDKKIQEEPAAAIPVPLENDKNVNRIGYANIIINAAGMLKPVNLNGKIYAVTDSTIIGADGEKVEMPGGFSPAIFASAMNDLDFIFLINKNNKILHFSPISKKFQENNLAVPENSQIAGAETYLTYLYLADANSNMIHRYPRAEGGFGEKSDWLKDSADLKNIFGMAIDENIYLAEGEKASKFFRGKRQEFTFEQSATPVFFSKIFTNDETANIYVLDSRNGRLIKYSKTGGLQNQYYHEKIKSALDLAVDEKDNKAYFTTANELLEIGL